MSKRNYGELQAKMAQEKQPLSNRWRPDILDKANEPESLRKFLFGFQTLLSEELIEDQAVGFDWLYDYTRKLVALNLKSWLYGEIVDTHTVKYPRDWFQHLKQRVLPGFVRERWPVRYRVIDVQILAIYPQLRKKLEFPDEKHVFHVNENEYDEEE